MKPGYESVRQEVLDRDDGECRFCGDESVLETHHIVPRDFGGQDTPENLITVCETCHQELQSICDHIVEWVQVKSTSDDMGLSDGEAPPYITRRKSVKQNRTNQHVMLLRDEYGQAESRLRREVANHAGVMANDISLFDIRESLYELGTERIQHLTSIMQRWGIELDSPENRPGPSACAINANGNREYPYALWRNNVKEQRDTELVALLRDEYSRAEKQIQSAIAAQLGTEPASLSVFDLREALHDLGHQHPERLAEILLDWGYDAKQ